jgi:hypothetical protein
MIATIRDLVIGNVVQQHKGYDDRVLLYILFCFTVTHR